MMGRMDPELIAALTGGAQVVTASARLARSLGHRYDAAQIAAGRRLWPEPRLLAWEDWIGALWTSASASVDLPYVATAAQEEVLWRRIISGAGQADSAALAAEAAAAWRLSQQWRIVPQAATAETEALAAWAAAMERELRRRRWITAAQTPGHLQELLAQGGIPGLEPGEVIPIGFAPFTRQQAVFFAAWTSAGGSVRDAPAPPTAPPAALAYQAACASEAAEAEAAAQWARQQVASGCRRIAIVVLDLERRRAGLERAFTLALAPAAWLPGGAASAPFHITLGLSLAAQPVIAAALCLLKALLPGAARPAAAAEALLRSPFLPGAAAERSARGRAAEALHQTRQLASTLAALLRLATRAGATQWTDRLSRAQQTAAAWPDRQTAAAWAQAFADVLQAAGWPGDDLASAEFQSVRRWQAMLEELARLEAVLPVLAPAAALDHLTALANEAVFQPEAPLAPVTILSPEAAAGEDWQAVWMLGAEAAAWPPPARIHPWLPAAAQRAAGIPRATPEGASQWAATVTARLCAGAATVVFSFAPVPDAESATPSPLIQSWQAYAQPAKPLWPATLPIADTEPIPSAEAPLRLPGMTDGAIEAGGGAAVFTDQSLCPFRAFAHHRLNAAGWEAPAAGLDAAARGTLLHQTLYRVFRALAAPGGQVRIPDADACAAHAKQAAADAVREAAGWPAMAALRSPGFASLETERLARTVTEWLVTVEAPRGPFSVIFAEQKLPGDVGGLRIHWRADRVDRMGDGEHGATMIVDFKSGGQHGPGNWFGERPKDLQLPLYAQLADPAPSGLAFAILKWDQMRFAGAAASDDLLPGCKPPKAMPWRDQMAAWHKILAGLAAEYLAGHAAVAPQAGACDRCDLPVLCRVGELGTASQDGGDGEDDTADGGEDGHGD